MKPRTRNQQPHPKIAKVFCFGAWFPNLGANCSIRERCPSATSNQQQIIIKNTGWCNLVVCHSHLPTLRNVISSIPKKSSWPWIAAPNSRGEVVLPTLQKFVGDAGAQAVSACGEFSVYVSCVGICLFHALAFGACRHSRRVSGNHSVMWKYRMLHIT
eukprot:6458533-Amphidinium_carterae.1